MTGGTLLIVIVVPASVGGLTPSSAASWAFNTASSSHVTLGVSDEVPVDVQVVPGSSLVGVIVQFVVSGSCSGSEAVPASAFAVPSVPEYGPPAFAVGGPLIATTALCVDSPPSSSRSGHEDRVLPEQCVRVTRGQGPGTVRLGDGRVRARRVAPVDRCGVRVVGTDVGERTR